jgi:hypothetical protein
VVGQTAGRNESRKSERSKKAKREWEDVERTYNSFWYSD